MEQSKFLVNKHHNIYNQRPLQFTINICTDCTKKKKEYAKAELEEGYPKDILNLGFIDILSNNKQILITTPTMVCPFGFNKEGNQLTLQFTNYKTDSEMNSFYNFIEELELKQMKYLGLNEDESDLYIPQIRYDKNGKYDPNLLIKVPFRDNSYNVDIRTKNSSCSVTNVYKFSKLKCDIFIDKIWKFNGKFICKWKVKRILVV